MPPRPRGDSPPSTPSVQLLHQLPPGPSGTRGCHPVMGWFALFPSESEQNGAGFSTMPLTSQLLDSQAALCRVKVCQPGCW